MEEQALQELTVSFFVLVLAAFIGFEVISKVPTTRHTPLMSGSNAISGIILVGAILVSANTTDGSVERWLALVAVTLASVNVVGGFVVTDRMLGMFKRKRPSGGGAP
jgi:NAD(P) transhydrogenase subunit alpha